MPDPQLKEWKKQDEKLNTLAETLKKEIYNLLPSSKHMSGRCLGRLEPTPSLKYKNVALAN
jgi:hypothetical protein